MARVLQAWCKAYSQACSDSLELARFAVGEDAVDVISLSRQLIMKVLGYHSFVTYIACPIRMSAGG